MTLVNPIRRIALPLLVLAFAAAPAAFAQEQAAAPSGPATQVETKKVCMVNDALFQKDQIPVEVEGKTYYGCCQMCKARLAEAIGAPTAARAVARACATNPVSVVIPCHRVVGSDGKLTGYRWGVARKKKLLEREKQK